MIPAGMLTIDLNCDMGEGLDNDALLMPYISSANIACGYHAGDESIMRQTVILALQNSVSIGAHPGFADKKNFGRTEMQLPSEEVYALVTEQILLLQTIAGGLGTRLHHVKPHGALYNMSAKDPLLAHTIAKATCNTDPDLWLYGLSGSHSITEAAKIGLRTVSEVFADRTYQANGSLTPRTQPHAMIDTEKACVQQVLQMIEHKTVNGTGGKEVSIIAETICLHGDGSHAVGFAKGIYDALRQKNIKIQSKSC